MSSKKRKSTEEEEGEWTIRKAQTKQRDAKRNAHTIEFNQSLLDPFRADMGRFRLSPKGIDASFKSDEKGRNTMHYLAMVKPLYIETANFKETIRAAWEQGGRESINEKDSDGLRPIDYRSASDVFIRYLIELDAPKFVVVDWSATEISFPFPKAVHLFIGTAPEFKIMLSRLSSASFDLRPYEACGSILDCFYLRSSRQSDDALVLPNDPNFIGIVDEIVSQTSDIALQSLYRKYDNNCTLNSQRLVMNRVMQEQSARFLLITSKLNEWYQELPHDFVFPFPLVAIIIGYASLY
jgi:hypothetical protein